jgi:hypothetical protein
MASRTAVFVEPVTRQRIRVPVGSEPEAGRASPASYQVTVELVYRGRVALRDARRLFRHSAAHLRVHCPAAGGLVNFGQLKNVTVRARANQTGDHTVNAQATACHGDAQPGGPEPWYDAP